MDSVCEGGARAAIAPTHVEHGERRSARARCRGEEARTLRRSASTRAPRRSECEWAVNKLRRLPVLIAFLDCSASSLPGTVRYP